MATKYVYVQFGCAFSSGEGWENFDSSATLRIERIPVVGKIISAVFSGNGERFPSNVRYGDICKGLPIAPRSAKGVYASHVLEHLSLQDCRAAIENTFSMLAPGGVFRLIVPDLQARSQKYIQNYQQGVPEGSLEFMRSTGLGREQTLRTPLEHIRAMIGSHHLWMWDEHSMSDELRRAGFINIRRCEFGDSTDRMFDKVEDHGRFVDKILDIHECALEAQKPT